MQESSMCHAARRVGAPALALALALMLAACSTPSHRAPVETRANGALPQATGPAAPRAGDPAPGTVEARPSSTGASADAVQAGGGSYVVKPGDTLLRIALETGSNWRDLARWNQLEDANRIEVGQVLRVAAPAGEAVAGRPSADAARPAEPSAQPAPPVRAAASSSPVASSPAAAAPAAAAPAPAAPP
ncbi:MAG: LysM peptidoglycan-binding domain-containing protein, partial [Burkholderiales bacterium]|nr:LysM peptidoglycan-binding domain-containing protein [Burkholderiales bacterium]